MVVGVIAGISLLCLGFRNVECGDDVAQGKCIFGFVGGTIFTIFVGIALMVQGADSMSKVFNPEYHAVQSLVQMVR